MNSIDELADAWIALQRSEVGSVDFRSNQWALRLNVACLNEPEFAWEVIRQIFESNEDAWILENLGSGPLETLLSKHGGFAVDAVKAYLSERRDFVRVLTRAWHESLAADVSSEIRRFVGDLG